MLLSLFVVLYKKISFVRAIFKALKNRIELKNEIPAEDTELKELVLIGENEKLELKSTLRYDIRENTVNKKLEFVIAKTISAFLNSEGGILIIGVDDDGNALGLDKDLGFSRGLQGHSSPSP